MTDFDELHRVFELHERSYRLFRWMAERARNQTLDFSVVHLEATAAEAAEDWIRRNLKVLPANARPEVDELPEFARLFSSYLKTSFEPVEVKQRRVSDCGCYCSYCSYLSNAPVLKARRITKAAKRDAEKLMQLNLVELVASQGIPMTPGEADRFV